MKQLLLGFVVLLSVGSVWAQNVLVDGYYRSDGTYVQGHYRSAPDGNKWNNLGPAKKGQGWNTYGRDRDGDGVWNQYDMDDDNDGLFDDYDDNQYGY